MGTLIMLIIAGNCIDLKNADEIEDIVKTSIIAGRMRELSNR